MYIMAFAFDGTRPTATFSSQWLSDTPVPADGEPEAHFTALWEASTALEAKTAQPVYWLATQKRISRKALEQLIALTDDLEQFLSEDCVLFDAAEDEDEEDDEAAHGAAAADEAEGLFLDDPADGFEVKKRWLS